MRLFVAVSPPPEARRAALENARKAARDLGDGVRWTKPENVHLTLKFLGEVDEGTLGDLCSALRAAVSAHVPFDARLGGLGAFPSPGRARVIWASMREGSEETSALAASVETALEPLGFRREGRPYVPHATLGRVRGRPVGLDLPEKSETSPPIFRVGGAELTKSTLQPEGPVYERMKSFALGGFGGATGDGGGR